MTFIDMIQRFWSFDRPTKKTKTYDKYVIQSILVSNSFGILGVIGMKSIRSMYFSKHTYASVVSHIQAENITALAEISDEGSNPTFQEYLEIIQFEDQNALKYIATLYDSIELWQNPEITDVFRQNHWRSIVSIG